MNGYTPEEELPENEFEVTRNKTEMIFPSPPEVKEPKKLTESAFTHILLV